MARATRSSAQTQEKEKHVELPINAPSKATSKKRKRTSTGDADDANLKQPRTDPVTLNGDLTHDLANESDDNTHDDSKPHPFPIAGDMPITADSAEKILDVLEMIDTQNLLDRVFPLPSTHSASSTSKDPQQLPSHSLRSLLKEASEHPLSVLRNAVQHLIPISYHPRSRPSDPAAQQLRFCNLALSLLDQASFHCVPIPPEMESLLSPPLTEPEHDSGTVNDDAMSGVARTASAIPSSARKRKYALMQRLPTGDWWTSLNSDFFSSARDLRDLPTGHAELVAILPSASRSANKEIPTLGSYAPKKTLGPKPKLPAPRRVSCGSFLDYGPNTSFAPSFDQEGREVGRAQLGEVYASSETRRRKRALVQTYSARNNMVPELEYIVEEDPMKTTSASVVPIEESLDGVLSKSQITQIKAALDDLELEAGVQELLERNRKALERLEMLQVKRLSADNGGSSIVDVGSEEWDTAQGIVDSLTLLASLRPRSSQHEAPPLIPPPSVLHKLHRTLLLAPTPGWNGTLPPTLKMSLRDDSTARIRSGATLPIPTVPSTTTAATATVAAPAPAHPYPAYLYTPYAAQQYRSAYVPYKQGQSTGYYGAYSSPASTTGQAQSTSASYYTSPYAGSGQQSYAYGGWYNYQPPTTAAPPTPGRGTPQPGSSTPTVTQAQPTPQRAVANTVLSKPYTSSWADAMGTKGYVAPTLPAHLRGSTTTPVTPSSTSSGGLQPTYYGAQATMPAAR